MFYTMFGAGGADMIPDYENAEAITIGATETVNYTAPQNGYIFMWGYSTYGNIEYYMFIYSSNGVLVQDGVNGATGTTPKRCSLIFPVKKGDVTTLQTKNITNNINAYFVPAS